MMRTDMPALLDSSTASTRVPSCSVPKSTCFASTAASESAGRLNACSDVRTTIQRRMPTSESGEAQYFNTQTKCHYMPMKPWVVSAALIYMVATGAGACTAPASVCFQATQGSFALIRDGRPAAILVDDDADPAVRHVA